MLGLIGGPRRGGRGGGTPPPRRSWTWGDTVLASLPLWLVPAAAAAVGELGGSQRRAAWIGCGVAAAAGGAVGTVTWRRRQPASGDPGSRSRLAENVTGLGGVGVLIGLLSGPVPRLLVLGFAAGCVAAIMTGYGLLGLPPRADGRVTTRRAAS